MQVLDPGHRYLLTSFDGGEPIELRFMKREGEGYPGNIGHYSGTNLQEVMRACIDRLQYLDKQVHAPEYNAVCIFDLRNVIRMLELRAAERHNREWKSQPMAIEAVAFCGHCGHIDCTGHV